MEGTGFVYPVECPLINKGGAVAQKILITNKILILPKINIYF